MTSNPYDPPSTRSGDVKEDVPDHSRSIRKWLYFHLLAVAASVLLSVADSRGLPIAESTFVLIALPLVPVSLGALVLCPGAVLMNVLRSQLPWAQRLVAILAEGLILVAHFFALAPAAS